LSLQIEIKIRFVLYGNSSKFNQNRKIVSRFHAKTTTIMLITPAESYFKKKMCGKTNLFHRYDNDKLVTITDNYPEISKSWQSFIRHYPMRI
jgi:hypothetical protein